MIIFAIKVALSILLIKLLLLILSLGFVMVYALFFAGSRSDPRGTNPNLDKIDDIVAAIKRSWAGEDLD